MSGTTTRSSLDHIENILSLRPSVVVVCLGTDERRDGGRSEELFFNLERIVILLEDVGAFVTVIGVPDPSARRYDFDPEDLRFRDLARRTKAFYISNILDGVVGNRELAFDDLSPSEKGYVYMAARVSRKLAPRLRFPDDHVPGRGI